MPAMTSAPTDDPMVPKVFNTPWAIAPLSLPNPNTSLAKTGSKKAAPPAFGGIHARFPSEHQDREKCERLSQRRKAEQQRGPPLPRSSNQRHGHGRRRGRHNPRPRIRNGVHGHRAGQPFLVHHA